MKTKKTMRRRRISRKKHTRKVLKGGQKRQSHVGNLFPGPPPSNSSRANRVAKLSQTPQIAKGILEKQNGSRHLLRNMQMENSNVPVTDPEVSHYFSILSAEKNNPYEMEKAIETNVKDQNLKEKLLKKLIHRYYQYYLNNTSNDKKNLMKNSIFPKEAKKRKTLEYYENKYGPDLKNIASGIQNDVKDRTLKERLLNEFEKKYYTKLEYYESFFGPDINKIHDVIKNFVKEKQVQQKLFNEFDYKYGKYFSSYDSI
jgi:hypothetical protein